jgi:hypothetical protein
VSYWTPRTDAPMRVCGGGACERRTDCRRWLERNADPASERYPTPPYRHVRAIDETGRPLNETVQVCEQFLDRTNNPEQA